MGWCPAVPKLLRCAMPRYFFDVHDSGVFLDDTGTECADLEDMRRAAMKLLPDLTSAEMPDGDRRIFSLTVRDDRRRAVFAVTLSLVGLRLEEPALPGG